MPRLFVALPLPEEIVHGLERLAVGLPAVRWVAPEALHLTLRFIGEVDRPSFFEIGERLADVRMPPFDLALEGLGVFPPRGDPHTLWVGVRAAEPLLQLKRRIDRCVDAVVPEREKRKFVPHVTIARFREPPPVERFGSWLTRRSLFTTAAFPVSAFQLYSSHLRSDGADHMVEAMYDFVTGVAERV